MFYPDILLEEKALAETLELQSSLFQIGDSYQAVKEYGITPTSLMLLCSTGLISNPALTNTIGQESFSKITSESGDIALESLLTAFKEKVAKWAGQVLDLVKNTGRALLDKIKSISTKILDLLNKTKDGAVAKGKDLQAKIKAHPVKTVLAAVAAIAGVIGVVSFATGNFGMVLKASKIPVFLKGLASLIGKITWPFGKLVPQVIKDHKIAVTIVGIPTATTAVAVGTLGWANQSSSTLAEKIRNAVDGISRGWSHVKEKVAPMVSSAGTMAKGIAVGTAAGFRAGLSVADRNASVSYHSAGSGEHSIFGSILTGLFGVAGAVTVGGATVIVSVLNVLYHLIKTIVFGTLDLVASTIQKVRGGKSDDIENYV